MCWPSKGCHVWCLEQQNKPTSFPDRVFKKRLNQGSFNCFHLLCRIELYICSFALFVIFLSSFNYLALYSQSVIFLTFSLILTFSQTQSFVGAIQPHCAHSAIKSQPQSTNQPSDALASGEPNLLLFQMQNIK